jgi:hypothetical protein
MPRQREHNFLIAEAFMTEHNHANSETRTGRSRAYDSGMKDSSIHMKESSRLPDIPWKYNPPAPENVVRPKPVMVPKAK